MSDKNKTVKEQMEEILRFSSNQDLIESAIDGGDMTVAANKYVKSQLRMSIDSTRMAQLNAKANHLMTQAEVFQARGMASSGQERQTYFLKVRQLLAQVEKYNVEIDKLAGQHYR